MYTLAIDTANKTLSVAVFKNKELINEQTQYDTLQHSVHLVPAIDKLLTDANCKVSQLERIIVSNGPGSYTGLRIGVTFAKTLAYTLSIPVYPVSSLQVLAQAVSTQSTMVIPFFDARRQNVYIGKYQYNQALMADVHMAMTTFLSQLPPELTYTFVSPDMAMYETLILSYLPKAHCLKAYPSASTMIDLVESTKAVDAHLLVPYYINKVEAETNLSSNLQNQAPEDLVERVSWKHNERLS